MKAKTISGDIITVIPKQYDGYVGYIEPSTGYYYDSENLTIVSFDDDFNPDYWTRLEHQYVGMAMQGLMSILPNIGGMEGRTPKDEIIDIATETAHALVEKMKEVNNG
jgi:hypothetical protein